MKSYEKTRKLDDLRKARAQALVLSIMTLEKSNNSYFAARADELDREIKSLTYLEVEDDK